MLEVAGLKMRVINDIGLQLEEGKSLAITGPSGSGKSTLLHCLAGIEVPEAGSVTIGDTNITALSDDQRARFRRRNIGLVFQSYNLVPSLTVLENVLLPCLLDGKSGKKLKERAISLMEELGVAELKARKPTNLSGGEMQRVAIARALMPNPRLILADEPTGNLDEENSANVTELLINMVKRHGKTLAMVTHDPKVASHCDSEWRLANGELTNVSASV